jgi:hypothetical protein
MAVAGEGVRGARLALLSLAALAACSGGGPGVVSGSAYLDLATGRSVSLAGAAVQLVPDEETLDSALVKLCDRRNAEAARPGGAVDTAALRVATERALAERGRILRDRATLRATAGPDARFVLDSVPPGRYRVWADTTVGGNRWSWLTPVTVKGGDTTRVDLNTGNTDDNPLKCRW